MGDVAVVFCEGQVVHAADGGEGAGAVEVGGDALDVALFEDGRGVGGAGEALVRAFFEVEGEEGFAKAGGLGPPEVRGDFVRRRPRPRRGRGG